MSGPPALARLARRTGGAVLAGWLIVAVAATPAAALQRDPFDPVIDTSAEATTDTEQAASSIESAATTETSTATTDTTQPATDDGTLPATGAGVSSWLAIAYVMIAAGAAMLTFGRYPGDALRRSQRRRSRS
jgi:hypothetical protein